MRALREFDQWSVRDCAASTTCRGDELVNEELDKQRERRRPRGPSAERRGFEPTTFACKATL